MSTPSHNALFTAPAVWRGRADTWMFAADNGGTVENRQRSVYGSLEQRDGWNQPGSRRLYVYDPNGALHICDPADRRAIANLNCGRGHWNSLIVADGRIALPEGNPNDHATVGVLNIWTVTQSK